MKDARTRKASNYFDKENQGILCPIRDSDELTIRNTHPILLKIFRNENGGIIKTWINVFDAPRWARIHFDGC